MLDTDNPDTSTTTTAAATPAKATRASRAAKATGHPYPQAIAQTLAGLVHLRRGQLEAALPLLQQSVDACREMGLRAEEMLIVAIDSFAARDLDGALRLVELDELIDRANRRFTNHVLELGSDPALREWGLRMLIVSRALERIGDHAVDIGEQTAYLVTGEFREFTDASHPEAQQL